MRGPKPPIELDEKDERLILAELHAMTREELYKVPHDEVRWQCKIKFCKGYTTARSYGVLPWFFHPRFGWLTLTNHFFMCGKHSKRYKRRNPEDIPLKKNKNGSFWGWDETVKPTIIF